MLEEAYTQAGRFEDAFATLNEALAVVDKNDDRFHEAELHRLKGELLLVASADQGREAHTVYRKRDGRADLVVHDQGQTRRRALAG